MTTLRTFFCLGCLVFAAPAIAKLKTNLSYGPRQARAEPFYDLVPSTYIWCDDDRSVRPEYQHQVAKAARWSEGLATGHSPMLSAPDLLVAALERALERVERR